MPTNYMDTFESMPYTGQDRGLDVLNFPGYPQLFTYEGRTKFILAHPHGIEHHSLEGGPLSIDAGVVEPGTFLHWKDEVETDRGGNPVTVKNLHPFVCAIPYGGCSADGDEFTLAFNSGSVEHDDLACNRFKVGQHVWALDRTDSTVAPEDLGEVLSIDEENNTINVENEMTITETDAYVYVAEEDTDGTFPTIVGISMYFSGPTNVQGTYKKGSIVYIVHGNVMRRMITNYNRVFHTPAYSTTVYPEGTLLMAKVKADVPLLRMMW